MAHYRTDVILDLSVETRITSENVDWMIEICLDEDGHLNIMIQDRTGGKIEKIREEDTSSSWYGELELRYASKAAETKGLKGE